MKRLFTATLLTLGLSGPGFAFDINNMSPQEQTAFRAEIRAYLLDNPGVIMEAVAALEAQEAQAQADADRQLVQANHAAIFEDGYSWIGGNPAGDVTVVEFIDYRCGFCRRAHDEVEELLAMDGNVRLIVKEFPILGEASLASSRFAIATKQLAGSEAYKRAHDALITMTGEVNDVTLQRLADTLDLDGAAILAHMSSAAVTQEIADTRALAQRLQISGTPTFVMGDRMVRGFVEREEMQTLVSEIRAR